VSFGDLYAVPQGTPQDPNLPAIDLPKVDAPPRRKPLSITVTPDRPQPEGDPFAGMKPWSGGPEKKAPEEPGGDPFADMKPWEPAKPRVTKEGKPDRANRDIGEWESGGIGLREAATFGAYPAIKGAIGTGQTEEERKASREAYESGHWPSAASELGALVKGLGKLGYHHLIAPALGLKDEGGAETERVYNEEREAAVREQEAAQAQNPKAYLTGQLGGAVLTPIPGMGAAKAAKLGVGTFERAVKSGITGGALYGGGSALGRGEDLGDIAMGAGEGGLAGGLAGGVAHGALTAGGKALGKGRDVVQGAVPWLGGPEAVARRQYGRELAAAQRTDTLGLKPHEYAQALADQMPVHGVDIGGDTTRRLARAVANRDPEAAQIIAKPLIERQEGLVDRFRSRVYRIMGGTLDRGADKIGLADRARIWNAPRYKRAYRAGDFPIGTSPEMQRLMGSDIIKDAMRRAVSTGKDRAIREKQGAFNPGVQVTPDGRLVFRSGPSGVPTYPNIQYWDYVQRELRDMAETATKQSKSRGDLIEGLRKDLNTELDKTVPEFADARAGAAKFFKAKDAVEAGENFALGKADFKDIRDAKRAIAQFSPAERELFARSVMDTITEALAGKPDWGTIKKLFTSPRAMEKIEAAIGSARARELEVGLTSETMARLTEEGVFRNSSSVRQALDALRQAAGSSGGHAAVGTSLLAGYEALKEGHVDPAHLIATAIVVGGLRAGVKHIDHQVALNLAKMLASEDTATARRAIQSIAHNPTMFKALRAGTEAGSRITAHEAGLAGIGAGMKVLYDEAMSLGHHKDEHQGDDQSIIDQGGHGTP
jgi:hypothetical protein